LIARLFVAPASTMPSRETRPISERSTELSPGRDVLRRLLFVLVVVGGPVGALLVLFGLTQHRTAPAAVGGVVVLAAALAWWLGRSSLASTRAEIAAKPFRPGREPKE
jgi:hypothetical protein